MTNSQTKLLALAGIPMFVTSCCTPGIRPEDANLFQASCALATGDFERQLENDKSKAAATQKTLETETNKADALETDLRATKAERDRLLQELHEMEKENQRIEAQITRLRAESKITDQKRAGLNAELRRIQGEVEVLKQKAAIEQGAFVEYMSEKARLKQDIETLRMIISAQ